MKFLDNLVLILKLILALLLVAFGMYFAMINKQQVSFDLLFFTVPSINLGLLIILSLLIGLLLGALVSSIGLLRRRKHD